MSHSDLEIYNLFVKTRINQPNFYNQLKKLADNGNYLAQGYISILLFYGEIEECNWQPNINSSKTYANMSLIKMKKFAENNEYAQTTLGFFYENALIGIKDMPEALIYYKKGVEKKFTEAQVYLGLCYAYGKGIPFNENRAKELFTDANNKGDAHAQLEFARIASKELRSKLYELSAEQGYAKEQFEFGIFLYNECTFEKWFTNDSILEKSGKWLLCAKNKKYPKAIEKLNSSGKIFYDNYLKITDVDDSGKKYNSSVDNLKYAGYMMYIEALLTLAECYKNGVIYHTFKCYECIKREDYYYSCYGNNSKIKHASFELGTQINELRYPCGDEHSPKFPIDSFKKVYNINEIIKKDNSLYLYYLKLAIINGSSKATHDLFEYSYTNKNWNDVIEAYNTKGISEMQTKKNIGDYYEKKNTLEDLTIAIKWYNEAKEPSEKIKSIYKKIGDIHYHTQNWSEFQKNWNLAGISEKESMRNIGDYYYSKSTHENLEESIKWYSDAKESPEKINDIRKRIGDYYYSKSTHENLEESIKWYINAKEPPEKINEIRKRIGDYYYSKSTPENWIEAIKWYSDAKESPEKINDIRKRIGDYYYSKSTPENWEESIKWYINSKESPEKINEIIKRIGDYYYSKSNPEQLKKAIDWYTKANIPICCVQNKIGNYYNSFLGNYELAREWYQLAADQNYPESEYHIGKFYKNGIGGFKKNQDEAEKMFCRSADHGHRDAKMVLYSDRPYSQLAFDWMLNKANEGNAHAQYCIGKNYSNGWVVKKNKEKSNMWYGLAGKGGYRIANIMVMFNIF